MARIPVVNCKIQYCAKVHTLCRLQGGGPFHIHSTDMEGCFRQEGYFHYMFGVEEEDYYGAMDRSGQSILFMPRLPPEHAVWMGPIAGAAHSRANTAQLVV